jgi:signal transduction histidine kinase
MKKPKIIVVLVAVALVATLGMTTVFASSGTIRERLDQALVEEQITQELHDALQESFDVARDRYEGIERKGFSGRFGIELTEEQQAQIEEQRTQIRTKMQESFSSRLNGLTDEQQAQISERLNIINDAIKDGEIPSRSRRWSGHGVDGTSFRNNNETNTQASTLGSII